MSIEKIYIGSDHAGYGLKAYLQDFLMQEGREVEDCGTYSEESCDYSDYALKVGEKVVNNKNSLGILICGTGIGVSIAVNKVHGVFGARCANIEDAELARKHNGANVICLGARQISQEQAKEIVQTFLNTKVEQGRHAIRRNKISEIEKSQCKIN